MFEKAGVIHCIQAENMEKSERDLTFRIDKNTVHQTSVCKGNLQSITPSNDKNIW